MSRSEEVSVMREELTSLVEELASALTESWPLDVPLAVYEAAQVRANAAHDALEEWLADRGWVLEFTLRGQAVARLFRYGLRVQVVVAQRVGIRGNRRWVPSPVGVAQLAAFQRALDELKTNSASPVRITDVKRGAVSPSPRTVRSLEAKIDSDPRWRQD